MDSPQREWFTSFVTYIYSPKQSKDIIWFTPCVFFLLSSSLWNPKASLSHLSGCYWKDCVSVSRQAPTHVEFCLGSVFCRFIPCLTLVHFHFVSVSGVYTSRLCLSSHLRCPSVLHLCPIVSPPTLCLFVYLVSAISHVLIVCLVMWVVFWPCLSAWTSVNLFRNRWMFFDNDFA